MEFYNETMKRLAHSMFHQRESKAPLCPDCSHEGTSINNKWYCLDCFKSFDKIEPICPICLTG